MLSILLISGSLLLITLVISTFLPRSNNVTCQVQRYTRQDEDIHRLRQIADYEFDKKLSGINKKDSDK